MAPASLKLKDKAKSRHASGSRPQLDYPAPYSPEDSTLEKDETEERLEKLLFGDDAGFLEGLQSRSANQQLAIRAVSSEGEPSDDAEGGLEAVADDRLFFLDSGADNLPNDWHDERDSMDDERSRREPAWVDSDDDRLYVSLASNARLRKLRNMKGEDFINGREYMKRLRRQYERLHPAPSWATACLNRQSHSIRRRSSLGSQSGFSDEGTGSDISLDEDRLVQSPAKALDDLLRSAGSLAQRASSSQQPSRPRKLRPEVLDIQRTKDVTAKGPSSVDSLQFHPYYPLILSSGPSSTISIHHISPHPPNPNPLLTSLHVKNTPLHSTAFLSTASLDPTSDMSASDSTTVYLSSRRRYIHTWSLSTGTITKISRPFTSTPHLRNTQRTTESFHLSPCGRYIGFIGSARKGGGYVNVFSTTTSQWLCTCRIDSRGGVADFAWWRDGNGFVVAGKNGECSEYNVLERRVVGRWTDEGAVGTTVIALGGSINSGNSGKTESQQQLFLLGGDRYVAIGSSSGIVNIYDRRTWLNNTTKPPPPFTPSSTPHIIPSNPSPLRTLTQLTTPTSHLHFSTDGQMLVMASRWKKDALRLVHLPSCTVYRNWPTDKTPLGRVSSVALSKDGALLAIGNERGKVGLWEIRE